MDEGKVNDEDLVEEILPKCYRNSGQTRDYTKTIGMKKADTKRPLMLSMKTLGEKEEFMSKLWMLKNLKMKFAKVSITNDYTIDEKEMIKEYVQEANERNAKESKGYKWKVRGTPKDGLKIVRFRSEE